VGVDFDASDPEAAALLAHEIRPQPADHRSGDERPI
jgi:hypothetical protein